MKSVNVKEWRLLEQFTHSNIWGWDVAALIKFIEEDLPIVSRAKKLLEASELYAEVWGDIQAKAEALVKEKCQPEWDRISQEMQPLGEERNTLGKEKAISKENSDIESWTEEKEKRLAELDKKMSDLSAEYQKVTDEANAELNEYKEKRINEEQGGCFLLEDNEYDLIWKYAGF